MYNLGRSPGVDIQAVKLVDQVIHKTIFYSATGGQNLYIRMYLIYYILFCACYYAMNDIGYNTCIHRFC